MQYNYDDLIHLTKIVVPANLWVCAFGYIDTRLLNLKPVLCTIRFTNFIHILSDKIYIQEYDAEWDYVYFFDTQDECIKYYNNMVWEEIILSNKNAKFWTEQHQKIKYEFIDTDYIMEKLRRSHE